jgi:hypothetical protein
VDANYGWGERIQLKLEIPWVVRGSSDVPAAGGLGLANLGVKWRFADEDRAGVGLATYPQLEFRTSSSSVDSGLVEGNTTFLLPLILEKHFGWISANLEVGHRFRSGAAGLWFAGLALGRELSQEVELAGEVYAKIPAQVSNTEVVWNFGGRWKFSRRIVLLLAGGTGIRAPSATPRARAQGYLGAQFLF